MRRARGKKSNINDLDVPEIVTNNYERHKEKTVKKPKKKSKKGKKKGKVLPKIIFALLLIVIIAFLLLMGLGWGPVGASGALVPVDMDKGKVNVLVLGVDEEGLRTDSMMLVSYDFINTKAELISIPRDTQIKVEDRKVTRKINEIHGMHDKNNNLIGPMGSIKAVDALCGIPIHFYVEFSFDAIDKLANILGPVEFDVPDVEGKGRGMNYDDPYQDLSIHLKPGLQELSGNQWQQFVRYRKSNKNTTDGSDISRVSRQQEFVKAIVDQKVNAKLIIKLPSIFTKMKGDIKTNFNASDVIKFSKYLKGLKSEAIHSQTLPGETKLISRGWYFVCDLDETEEMIEKNFGYEVEGLTNKININDIDGTKNVLKNKEKKQKTNETEEDSSKDEIIKNDKKEEKSEEKSEKKSDTSDEENEELKVEVTQDSQATEYYDDEDLPIIDTEEDDVITLD